MSIARLMQMGAAAPTSPEGAWDLSFVYYNSPPGWDISTTNNLRSFSVASQENAPAGIFFKPDGLKMYVAGSGGDDINEYELSTAWDISSASYSQNFDLSVEVANPRGIFFKPDGAKLYVAGSSADIVYEYDLSTAWDISSASYLQNFNVQSQEGALKDVFLKQDGLKMYIVGSTSDSVSEYDLSTAWDISSASYLQNFSVNSQDGSPESLFFKPDGSKLYVLGSAGDNVYEYDLSTAWDVSSASFLQSSSVQDTSPRGVFFKSDGSAMYIAGASSDVINQFTVGGFNINAQGNLPTDIHFKTDGLKMYISDNSGNAVDEYDLSTAWDVLSASFLQTFSVGSQETTPEGLFFKPDGLKMYVIGSSSDSVNEYDLSTAWDVSSATYSQAFDVSAKEGGPRAVFFRSDGAKMYICGVGSDAVHEYDLSTAWDVSSASFLQTFSVAPQAANPESLFFKSDGLKMFILGDTNLSINEYDLSTAWDISSASYSQNFSLVNFEPSPQGLFFREDGTQMFMMGQSQDDVFTFNLGVE